MKYSVSRPVWDDPDGLRRRYKAAEGGHERDNRSRDDAPLRKKIALNASSVTDLDWASYNYFEVTVDENVTFTFSNPRPSSDFVILLIKDNSGTARNIVWPASASWPYGTPFDSMTVANQTVLLRVSYFGGEYRMGYYDSAGESSTVTSVWGGITGTLSDQTDLINALNGKVAANGSITGATKTKVTYDAKGLVTAGADATTADVADSTDKRYVSDADLVTLTNTTNVNSGDQTSIVGISGTKAEFNVAVTDGDFLFSGDVTSNATHTGHVTGDTALTLDKTAITSQSADTPESTDQFVFSDTSDSGNLKKASLDQIAAAISSETIDDRVASLLTAGTNITLTYNDAANTLTIDASGGSALADGDYGDITVSGTGTVFSIDAGVVSTTELGGDITVAGKALLDDADASAQRTTLGLGTAATTPATDYATAVHTHTAANVTDFSEAVDDRVASLLTAGTNVTLTYNDGAGTLTIDAAGGSGLSDGDYGDISVSSSGTVISIDADVVTYAKMQNVSATARVLGRKTAGSGDVEELNKTDLNTLFEQGSAILGSDILVDNGVFADVTGLSFTADANGLYLVDVYGTFQSSHTTNGMALAMNIPSGDVSGMGLVPITTTTNNSFLQVADDAVLEASTGVAVAATNYPFFAHWVVRLGSTGGTVQLRFKDEIASTANSATLKAGTPGVAGTIMFWKKVA